MFRLNTLFASTLLGLSIAASVQADPEIKFGVDPVIRRLRSKNLTVP
jgi:hypothetical protein